MSLLRESLKSDRNRESGTLRNINILSGRVKGKHGAIRETRERPVEKSVTKFKRGASLVAQWLRIHLTMQGTWVQALVQEDPTCCGAAKPVHHNY